MSKEIYLQIHPSMDITFLHQQTSSSLLKGPWIGSLKEPQSEPFIIPKLEITLASNKPLDSFEKMSIPFFIALQVWEQGDLLPCAEANLLGINRVEPRIFVGGLSCDTNISIKTSPTHTHIYIYTRILFYYIYTLFYLISYIYTLTQQKKKEIKIIKYFQSKLCLMTIFIK